MSDYGSNNSQKATRAADSHAPLMNRCRTCGVAARYVYRSDICWACAAVHRQRTGRRHAYMKRTGRLSPY